VFLFFVFIFPRDDAVEYYEMILSSCLIYVRVNDASDRKFKSDMHIYLYNMIKGMQQWSNEIGNTVHCQG
jgi:hypothetical protein